MESALPATTATNSISSQPIATNESTTGEVISNYNFWQLEEAGRGEGREGGQGMKEKREERRSNEVRGPATAYKERFLNESSSSFLLCDNALWSISW
jgi:hypothetical protein